MSPKDVRLEYRKPISKIKKGFRSKINTMAQIKILVVVAPSFNLLLRYKSKYEVNALTTEAVKETKKV